MAGKLFIREARLSGFPSSSQEEGGLHFGKKDPLKYS